MFQLNKMKNNMSSILGPEVEIKGDVKVAGDLLLESIEKSGFKPGVQISLALDVASTEFFKDNSYNKYWGGWAAHIFLWWSDPIKKKKLKEARLSKNISLPIENEIIDFWNKLN